MALALLAGCMHVPPRTVDAEEAQVPERWHAPLTVEPAASAAVPKEAASAASTPAKGAQAPGLDALYDWWGRWNDPALLTLIGAAEAVGEGGGDRGQHARQAVQIIEKRSHGGLRKGTTPLIAGPCTSASDYLSLR